MRKKIPRRYSEKIPRISGGIPVRIFERFLDEFLKESLKIFLNAFLVNFEVN